MTHLEIPAELLPADGRFGSGPSKVPTERLDALAATGTSLMGTSHRAAPVKRLVRRVREGMAELFSAPDGYEVVIANGGTHGFWDAAVHCLVRDRSQHATCGEFGAKFTDAATRAPWLADPAVISAEPGSVALPVADGSVDVYAWVQNETSTGVMAPVSRPEGSTDDQLVLVDATSAAGGLPVDLAEADVYYFAPPKGFAAEGGMWVGLFSPTALARVQEVVGSGRYVPATLDLTTAITQSRLDQTLNTPSISTLFLMVEQTEWMLASGGLSAMVDRCRRSAAVLYDWAERAPYARPFVDDPDYRSTVVATIDFTDEVDAAALAATLRANGVVDTEPYRKLGRNQLRIGMYPSVDHSDVEALTRCIDWVVERS